MSPEQVHILRKSFADVERYPDVAALVFYQELFALEPRLRAMFGDDIAGQGRKLIEMLGVGIRMLDDPAGLAAVLEESGRRHADYGVQARHYPIVRRALMTMLRRMLDRGMTVEIEEAWMALYDMIEAAMLRGAAAGAGKPGAAAAPDDGRA